MTKRSGIKPTLQESQADLFGGAPPRAAKKARVAKPMCTPGPPPRTIQSVQLITPDALLTVRQAAARLGLSKSTLDKMRGAGKGPRFIKSTDRAVRYDPQDLDAWITNRRRTSTSPDWG